MTWIADPLPALAVETVVAAESDAVAAAPLLEFAETRHPLAFLRRGEGLIGIGEALRVEFSGPDRIERAAESWRAICASARITDAVETPGSGLVAFGAFSFAADSATPSVLIVPRVVIGRRGGRSWVTTMSAVSTAAPSPVGALAPTELRDGALTANGYREAVAQAVEHIRTGAVSKVVLARDLVGRLGAEADLRALLSRLGERYPDTWTFAVDGLLGSSPETLVSVAAGVLRARVLAGSTARGTDATRDTAAAARLAASGKDLAEHAFAVRNVLDSLAARASAVRVSEHPFTLELPNLWHLASDIEAELDGDSALDIAAALHPTAAVAGTPTDAALRLLEQLERADRGRYAGPVGWIDHRGDGDWAIALRSAEIAADGAVRAFAGAGIVAASDPAAELAETELKFAPIRDALGGR